MRWFRPWSIKYSFWTVESPCGAEGVGSRICPLLSCTRDIESHLVSLGLGSKRGATVSKITEVELILNRAGRFDVREDEKSGMAVCPRHRKGLTTDWISRKRTVCCQPTHKGQRKGNTQTRRANAEMSQAIFNQYNAVVPIGSGSFFVN